MSNINLDNLTSGEIITFGLYRQTTDGADTTPIKWRVLQICQAGLLVLSEHILDCKRFHSEFAATSWRDCALRKWLNEEFYHAAFNDAAKERIKTTLCTDNGDGIPDTQDKIFLLGVDEVKKFTLALGQDANTPRRAVGTEFAREKKADGCRFYVYDKSISRDYLIEDGKKQGCSWWWLRTQLGNQSRDRATFVGIRASLHSYGRVNLACYGVRPALKLRLLF